MHFRAVGGEGEAVLGDFEECDTKGPYVRGYGITLSGYALGGHVVGSADEGVGIALGAELAADAEVAKFDLAAAA